MGNDLPPSQEAVKYPKLARLANRAEGHALMRINIWMVLVVLVALLAVTRLSRYQHDTQRICADDPSALGVRAVRLPASASTEPGYSNVYVTIKEPVFLSAWVDAATPNLPHGTQVDRTPQRSAAERL